jgi:hypothetical protein
MFHFDPFPLLSYSLYTWNLEPQIFKLWNWTLTCNFLVYVSRDKPLHLFVFISGPFARLQSTHLAIVDRIQMETKWSMNMSESVRLEQGAMVKWWVWGHQSCNWSNTLIFNYALAKEYWLQCSTDSVSVHPGFKKCWLTAQLSQVFDDYLCVHTLYLLRMDALVSMKIWGGNLNLICILVFYLPGLSYNIVVVICTGLASK